VGLVAQVSANAANDTPVTTTSGTAAGLLAAITTYLPSYQTQLNQVASNLASYTNGQLADGYTTLAGSGDPLFVAQGGSGAAGATPITAANIAVNPTVAANPMTTLAVSSVSTSAAANNGANAQVIAENGSMTTTAANQDYTNFIQNLGSNVQGVNDQVTAQTSVASAATQNLSEIAGVSTNSQMVALINYQQTYQASAEVITTVNTAVQSLLSAI